VSPAAGRWEIVVRADPALDTEPDPDNPCPTDPGALYFRIDLEDTLIGRQDLSRNIAPDIGLRDKAVSHRHASIYLDPDGALTIVDLNSTNGTQLNGTGLVAGAVTPLAAGDVLALGAWTTLTVQERP
jgi:pSer/pThr/pTyr-binding forkhead associated (FHA) protein